MPFPVGLAIAGGASILGSVMGSRDQGVPPWMIDLLREKAGSVNQTGFLPDKAAYDANLQAQLDSMMAGLPVSQENFNADLAARGIYSSGEAPKRMYSDVIAPFARAGASAVAQSNLGYAQAYQQGSQFGANLEQNYLSMLTNATINQQPSIAGTIGGGIQNLGGMGTQYYLLKELGLV